jgi:hypothetical protein
VKLNYGTLLQLPFQVSRPANSGETFFINTLRSGNDELMNRDRKGPPDCVFRYVEPQKLYLGEWAIASHGKDTRPLEICLK